MAGKPAGLTLSRCIEIKLARRDLAPAFAALCQSIATKEGLNGQDISEYMKLAKSSGNNCRKMLQAIESGEMQS